MRNRHRFHSRLASAAMLLIGGMGCAAAIRANDSPPATGAAEHVSHGRFENVAIYAPVGTPTSFVLLLSDDGGWNPAATSLAERLSRHGAMVAGIDLKKLTAKLEADDSDCVFPDGDLENLSHFVQAYYHLPAYLTPFLVGYRGGAGLSYGTLVQAPPNTFAGALTLGFCPASNLRKPLCKGSGLEYGPRGGERGTEFLPAKQLANPWVDLQGERDAACNPRAVGDFIGQVHGAALVVLPGIGFEYSSPAAWLPQLVAAFDSLVKHSSGLAIPPAPPDLGKLPVIEIPAQAGTAAGDTFAIILSGDGGWAGLDKEVALALSARGIPVVGLDSLRYFWTARTPDGLAADTDHMIRYYLAHLDKKRVLLIGYSQGADVLPFAVNRLPAATRARVSLTALMGMSEHALFEFHVSSWISNGSSGPPTLPEVARLAGTPVLCIYGEDDNDSLCPKLDPRTVRVVKLKGGHHFNGDYASLAREILASANP
ncbi:MAG: virulence factor family protein [Steroidobacteraceae bacterium]